MSQEKKIHVVGIGPGNRENMTLRALQVLQDSDVIVGYRTYTDLIKEQYPDKEIISSDMKKERERCLQCVELARNGKTVALICSGDPGIYGMASPMLEVASEEGFTDVEIVPGVTAASSGASLLGAPIGHDFCVISLSDLLTPWELIEKRLKNAAAGDFNIVLYNPASHKRQDYLKRACKVLTDTLPQERICGLVRNIGRENEECRITTLGQLADADADMFTTVWIGNSQTRVYDQRMITPRGYDK